MTNLRRIQLSKAVASQEEVTVKLGNGKKVTLPGWSYRRTPHLSGRKGYRAGMTGKEVRKARKEELKRRMKAGEPLEQ